VTELAFRFICENPFELHIGKSYYNILIILKISDPARYPNPVSMELSVEGTGSRVEFYI
jgi:hypothetical protein